MSPRKKTLKEKKDQAEVSATEKVADTPQPPKNRFLLPDNTAVSPIEEYPGTIYLPSVFGMQMHRTYTEAAKDNELQRPYILSVEGSDEFLAFNRMHYDMVVSFGRIDIKNNATLREDEESKPFDFEDFGSIPTVLCAFIGIVGLEYLRRHTQFPGFRGSDMEISGERGKNGATMGA